MYWEDVYKYAHNVLKRDPTQMETIQLFETIQRRMISLMGDVFPEHLEAITDTAVEEMLRARPYNPHSMTREMILTSKYCHECNEVQKSYWELNYCDKNPQGIDPMDWLHGNDDECSDEYCNPDSATVDVSEIDPEYVKGHAVHERCAVCHQYFDSSTPIYKEATQ